MNGKVGLLTVAIILSLSSIKVLAEGKPPFDIEKDPYVLLYRTRVELQKAQLERQKTRSIYDDKKAERAKKLWNTRAMSQEEYENALSAAMISSAGIDEATQRLKEAEALLEICKVRIESGKEMPILPISGGVLQDYNK